MKTFTIQLDDEQQYQKLLEVARQAGIEVVGEALTVPAPALPDVSKMSREELLAIIDRGGDGQSIPDPVAWQREQRQERSMPFRP